MPVSPPSPLPTDAQLLCAYLGGDPQAFARLYDRYDRQVFGFIAKLLRRDSVSLAEDLHQECWLAVAKGAASFDEGKARFVTWLFTIARNKVMDHYRADRSAAEQRADDLGLSLADFSDTLSRLPERVLENRQLSDELMRAVQALPEVQRETFLLFAQMDISLGEVASITGVGLETAKSRLRYARDALRADLRAWRPQHV
nr:sigma-70 family RNA polymerase sigma factor [uncultured Roseateles sp.]